jgi:hypothetical protein
MRARNCQIKTDQGKKTIYQSYGGIQTKRTEFCLLLVGTVVRSLHYIKIYTEDLNVLVNGDIVVQN